jgi:hypothetical protein
MKTKLTPERKAIRDAQTNKWYMGDRGGAISYPYCIKHYLSKELSDKIATEIQNEIEELGIESSVTQADVNDALVSLQAAGVTDKDMLKTILIVVIVHH